MPSIPQTKLNPQWLKTLRKHKALTSQENDDLEVFTFRPDLTQGFSGVPVNDVYNSLFSRNNKARLQVLQCAILMLSQCLAYTTNLSVIGFLHSRSTAISARPTRYKGELFSNVVLTKVLDALTDCGFVRCYTGFKGAGFPKGLTTLWVAEEAFSDWLLEHRHALHSIQFTDNQELIVLRDSKKQYIDYRDSNVTNGLRERLQTSNSLRLQYEWAYIPFDRNYWRDASVRRGKSKKEYYQFNEGDEYRVILPSDLICKRSFRSDFETGGRFYCNAQSLSQGERKTITINGKPTVEIDIKSIHPRLLYNLEKLEAPYDCYAADTKEKRNLNKHISMLVLNCKSMSQAVKSLMYERGIDKETSLIAIEGFISSHTPIKHHFFKSKWEGLQYLDSVIVDIVLTECVRLNIPVLPIHDSFIASTEHVTQLQSVIESAYEEVTKYKPEVSMGDNPDAEEFIDELLARYNDRGAKFVENASRVHD